MRYLRWLSAVLILAGCALIALAFRLSSHAPVALFNVPAPLASGEKLTRDFEVPSEMNYQLRLELTQGAEADQKCALGLLGRENCADMPLLALRWQISSPQGTFRAGDTSKDPSSGLWQANIMRVLADFPAHPATKYTLTATSALDQRALARLRPQLTVDVDPIERRSAHDRFALAYLFGRILAGWGVLILVAIWAKWIPFRR